MLVRGLFWYEYGERFPSKSIIAPPQQRSEWRLMVAGSLLRGLLPIVFAGQRPDGRCRRPIRGNRADRGTLQQFARTATATDRHQDRAWAPQPQVVVRVVRSCGKLSSRKPAAWRESLPRPDSGEACEESPQSWPRSGISLCRSSLNTPAVSAICWLPERALASADGGSFAGIRCQPTGPDWRLKGRLAVRHRLGGALIGILKIFVST
jgi:hypothetical protein